MADDPVERLLQAVGRLAQTQQSMLVAIDGRCGAGKTTLAADLRERIGCGVVHMDDFFLRPEQRTPERLAQPGGNVDWERFLAEVLLPLKQCGAAAYRPYLCHTQSMGEPVILKQQGVIVVEGSYSCHPELWDSYHLHVFLDVSPEEQLRRIQARNGTETARVFRDRWIPLEESYFHAFPIAQRCELRFQTG